MTRHCSICHLSGHDARRHRNPFGFGKEARFTRAVRAAEKAYDARVLAADLQLARARKRGFFGLAKQNVRKVARAERVHASQLSRAKRIRDSAVRAAERRYG